MLTFNVVPQTDELQISRHNSPTSSRRGSTAGKMSEAIEMNRTSLEMMLDSDKKLSIKHKHFGQDVVEIRNKETSEKIAEVPRRGRKVALLPKSAPPLPDAKAFKLPGIKKQFVVVPAEDCIGWVNKAVAKLAKMAH